MDVIDYIGHLQREGDLLANTANAIDPGASIPTCPEWQVRDLVHHLGGVHRWATTIVRDARAEPPDQPLEQVAGGWPDDVELVSWFRDGHRALVESLSEAEPDLDCWSFLPAATPLTFWARRQMNETAVHRVDIQGAAGAVTPIETEPAEDGIDEFLRGFAAGRRRWPWAEPRRLVLHAADRGREWHVQIGPERVEMVTPDADWVDDLLVAGTASDLLLLLWNRTPLDEPFRSGDAALLDSWRELVLVRWTE